MSLKVGSVGVEVVPVEPALEERLEAKLVKVTGLACLPHRDYLGDQTSVPIFRGDVVRIYGGTLVDALE